MKRIALITGLTIGVVGMTSTAHADGPTIDIQATCDSGLTITTSGYPDGQVGFFSIGGEPPRQLLLNSVSHTDWPENLTDHSYLIFTQPGDPSQVYGGDPQCTTATIETPPTTEPTIEAPVAEPVVVDVIDTSIWTGVELAPPW